MLLSPWPTASGVRICKLQKTTSDRNAAFTRQKARQSPEVAAFSDPVICRVNATFLSQWWYYQHAAASGNVRMPEMREEIVWPVSCFVI